MRRTPAILLFVLALQLPGSAEDRSVLLPFEVVNQVLSQHPKLGAARHYVEGAQAFQEGAGALANPIVRLALVDGTKPEDTNSLTQVFEVAGQPRLRLKIAQAQTEQARQDLAQTARELSLEAATRYYNFWGARRRLEIAQRRLELANRAQEIAQKRLEAGEISANDLRRVKLQTSSAEATLGLEQAQLKASAVDLRALMGLPQDQDLQVPEGLEPPLLPGLLLPEREHLAGYLDQLPELQLSHWRARQAWLEADLAARAGAPDLFLFAYRADASPVALSGIQLGVSFPLFDWGRLGAQAALQRKRAEAAQQEVEAVRRQLEAELYKAFEQWSGQKQQVELLTIQAAEVEELARLSLLSYEAGFHSLLELLNAQRTYQTTLLSLVDSSVELQKQRLRLYYLTEGLSATPITEETL